MNTGASNSRAVGRHIEAPLLKFHQVPLYGAVRHALTWISTRSAWYPAVCLVCSKLCVLISPSIGVGEGGVVVVILLIYSTSLKINAQSSYMTCAFKVLLQRGIRYTSAHRCSNTNQLAVPPESTPFWGKKGIIIIQ